MSKKTTRQPKKLIKEPELTLKASKQDSLDLYSSKISLLNCLLLEIHWANIFDYFDQALVCPSKLIKNRVEYDLQSSNTDYLILTRNCTFTEPNDNTCFIELILTEEELKGCLKNQDENTFYLDKPLPISRINNIYLNNIEAKARIINMVKSGATSFIPEELFEKIPANINVISTHEMPNLEAKNYLNETNKFDKIMGMFAFIKNTQFYYSKQTYKVSNYSANYFKALGALNHTIKEINKITDDDSSYKIFNRLLLKTKYESEARNYLINSIYSNLIIDKDYLCDFVSKYLSESDSNEREIIKHALNKFLNPIEKRASLKEFYNVKSKVFYQVATLATYGNKEADDKDILKNSINNDIPIEQAESMLALFGLYYGYKRIRPSETIEIPHFFQDFSNKEFNMKFKLDSKLDYYTIESIYQYAFNENFNNNHFDYLSYPENVIDQYSKIFQNLPNEFESEIRKVLDVECFIIRKIPPLEIIERKLKQIPNTLTDKNFLFIYARRNLGNSNLIKYNNNGFYFSKDELFQVIKSAKLNDLDLLNYCLDSDIKNPQRK